MKRLLTLILLNNILVIFNYVNSATVGDYRTAQSTVTWSSASHWQTWDGSTWSTASTPPGSSNDVYIQAGHTVTLAADANCNNVYISTGTTNATSGSDAIIELVSYKLNVYGKICCYYGLVDVNNGSTSGLSITTSSTIPTPPFSKASGGVLKFVGNTRNITNTGEWGAGSGAYPSTSLFDIEIALNSGQTATMQTTIKACNWTISSGTLYTGSNSISADNGTDGQGDVTISEGAILSSTGSGTSNSIIQRTSSIRSGTLYLNGTLKTTALSPYIQCNNISIGTNGTVEYIDNGNQNFIQSSFSGAAELLNYKHIVISGSGNKTTISGKTYQITADGSLTIKGGTFALGSGSNLTVSSSNTTLIYQGSSSQTISSSEWNTDFQNLKINNSSGVTLTGFSRTLNGKLYLMSGTFSNGSNLTFGNSAEIILTDGALGSVPTFGTNIDITYNQSTNPVNSGNEIPASSSVLNNLSINNSNGITLSAATTLNGTLTLTSGKITTTSSNLLTLESGSVVTGGSSSSFIIGPICKKGASDFTFPVGKSNTYSPVRLTSNSGNSSDYFTIEYFNSAPSNRTSLGTGLSSGKVSETEYWNISPNNTQTAVVTLYWNSNASGITNLASSHLVVAHYNSGNWISDDNLASSGSSSAGSVTSGTVSSWGNFTFGSPNNQNPLPVKLTNFRVHNNENTIFLNWSTFSEINCNSFTIQKSADSVNFYDVAVVQTKAENGNSTTKLDYSYTYFEPSNYIKFYRLQQTDHNGDYYFSHIIKRDVTISRNEIKVFDNKIELFSIFNQNTVQLIDLSGKHEIIYFAGNTHIINIEKYKSGVFFISLNNNKPLKVVKMVE